MYTATFIRRMTKQTIQAFLISLSVVWVTAAHANESALPPESKQQEWLADIIQNVDMGLFFRIQRNILNNMNLVGPYSQEYYQCLKAEGVIDETDKTQQNLTLEQLFDHIASKGKNCHYIVQNLLSQMQFDITEEEFEQGLSPKYQAKYRDLKNSI